MTKGLFFTKFCIAIPLLFSPVMGLALPLSSSFSLDGQLSLQGSGEPLLDADLRLTVQILDPSRSCILFEEIHKLDTNATNGRYSILVGSSALPVVPTLFPRRGSHDSGHASGLIYQNSVKMAGQNADGEVCAGSEYTPASGDGRALRLIVQTSGGAPSSILSPDTEIGSVPQAMVAESVQGYRPQQFLILDPSKNTTQASVSNFFGSLDGLGRLPTSALPSSVPVANLGTGTADNTKFLRGDGVWVGLPAGTTPDWNSVTDKPDALVGIAGLSCSDGQVLKLASGAWSCGVDSDTTTDASKLPLSGGTLSGDLNMGSRDILATGHITMGTGKILRFGSYDNAAQATQVASLAPGHEGSVWYNSTRDSVNVWTGTEVREVVGLTLPSSTENGQSLRWNDSLKKWDYFTAGAAGAGIATLNGQGGNDQLFAVTATGTSLSWSSATDTHTLQIPMADQTGVAAGLISKSQFDVFNAKQASLPAALSGQFLGRGVSDWESQFIKLNDIKNGDGTVAALDLTNCGPARTLQWISVLNQVTCVNISGLGTAALSDGAVTTVKIADAAITATQIQDAAVTNQKLATGISASKITTDVFSVARLGSGTADNTTFLRGDGAWSSLPAAALPDWSDVTNKPSVLTVIAGLTCLDGQILKLNAGQWVCGTDTDTDTLGISTLTGAITGSGTGSVVTSLSDAAVTTNKIADASVTNVKIASVDAAKLTGDISADRLPSSVKYWRDEGSDRLEYKKDDRSLEARVVNTGISNYTPLTSSSTERYPGFAIENYSGTATAGNPILKFQNARGNMAAPEALQAHDYLGSIDFFGANGNGYGIWKGATIEAKADAAYDANSARTNILFLTSSQSVLPAIPNPVERMRITHDGRVGMGTSSPEGALDLVKEWAAPVATNLILQASSYGDQSRLTLRSAGGTKASPIATKAGDVIGNFNFRGFDGAQFASKANAAISALAAENFTATAQGTYVIINTTPIGQTVGNAAMKISDQGNVGIAVTTPQRLLHVNGPIRVVASALPGSPATGDIAVDSGDGNKLKWYNGSEWQAAGSGRTSCPTGFSLVGTSGSTEAFCISTNMETSGTWLGAVTSCTNKTPKARLCSVSEWVHACVKAVDYGISSMTGHWEWVADISTSNGQAMGSSACDSFSHFSVGSNHGSRCCFR